MIAQSRRVKQLIQISFDSLVLTLAYIFCFILDSGSMGEAISKIHLVVLLIAVPVCLFIFYSLGLYRSLVRYISADSLARTTSVFFISAVIFWILSASIDASFGWTHAIIFALLSCALGLGGRFMARSFLRSNNNSNRSNVIVYGAKDLGRELLIAIKQRNELIPVAIIDDDPELNGALIGGVRVHSPQDLQKLVLKKRVSTILVATSEVTRESKKRLSNLLKSNDIQIKLIPAISDILSGHATITQFQSVKIEDLLGRKPVPPIKELMHANTSDRSILVTGAGGSIGSEICKQLIELKPARLRVDYEQCFWYKIIGKSVDYIWCLFFDNDFV